MSNEDKISNPTTSQDIKLWIEQGEIENHISEINKTRITPEIFDILTNYDFPIDKMDKNQLKNMLDLNDKLFKFKSALILKSKFDSRKRIIGENGKPNLLIVDVNTNPKFNDKIFNKNFAIIYDKLGKEVMAYKYYKIAAEQGDEDSEKKLIAYAKIFAEKYKKINKIILDAKRIYQESTEENLQENITKLAKKYIDPYIKSVEEYISESTITTLKEYFALYLKNQATNWEMTQFSGFANPLASCIEDMINKLIFERFSYYLQGFADEEPSTKALKDFEDKTGKSVEDYKFAFGQFTIFAQRTTFIKWLYSESVNIKYSEIENNDNFKQYKDEWIKFVDTIDDFTKYLRNSASHGGVYIVELQFKDCLNEMFLKENNIMDKILEFSGFPKYDPPVSEDDIDNEKENNLLNEIDIQELRVQKFDFEGFCYKLVEYKNRNGHLNIKSREKDIDGYPLGQKIALIKKGALKLSHEQKQQLIDLGLNLKQKEFDFESFYNRIVEYKNRNGNLYIKMVEKDIDGYPLGQKIAQIRKGYLKLSEEQKEKLEKVGIVFKYEIPSWFETFYYALLDYKNEHGSFKGVEDDEFLGSIIESIQRQKGIRIRRNLIEGAIDRVRNINPQMERVLIKTGLFDYLYSNTKKPEDDGFTI